MTINLDEITKALAEATPGPWEHVTQIEYDITAHYVSPRGTGGWVAKCGSEKYYSDKDAHLIANAPEWLRLLVEQNRAILARNDELQRRVELMEAVVDVARNYLATSPWQ